MKANVPDYLAMAAFVAVTVGLAMERVSLALIVPGVFVLACLIYDKLKGSRNA